MELIVTMSLYSFNAARGFVGGAAVFSEASVIAIGVSMPHAALWVVQQGDWRFYYVGSSVSMPHAALWVVQR